MGRSRGIIVFRACVAVLCTAAFTAGASLFIGTDVGPFPEFTYDIYLGLQSSLYKDSTSNPYMVILENSPSRSSRYAPYRSISSSLEILGAAGITGLFITDVFRTGESEAPLLKSIIQSIPTVMTGGICASSGTTIRAPRFPIPGTPPPDIPLAGGFYTAEGAFSSYTAGFLNIIPDSDGILRRIPLVYRLADDYIPSAILAYALSYLRISFSDLSWSDGRYLNLGSQVSLPVDRAGNVLITYPYTWKDSFYTYRTDSFTLPDRYLIPQLRQELLDSFVFLIDSLEQSNSIYAPNRKIFPAAGIAPILVNQISLGKSITIESGPHQALYSALWISFITAVMVYLAFSSGSSWLPPLIGGILVWMVSGFIMIQSGRYLNPFPAILSSAILLFISSWWNLEIYKRHKESESILREQEEVFTRLGKDAAGINHSVKGQISLAQNFTKLLDAEPLTAQGRTELTFLTRTLDELSNSVDSVLSKIRNKEKGADCTSPADALRAFVQSRSDVPGLPRIQLKIQPITDFNLWIDPDSFTRIMEILYVNAVESGTATIVITYKETPDSGIITVSDKGKGFRDCMHCTVAQCMDCSTIKLGKTTKKTGTGFGLFWARTLIARYNGTFLIRSSRENGTSVCFTLISNSRSRSKPGDAPDLQSNNYL